MMSYKGENPIPFRGPVPAVLQGATPRHKLSVVPVDNSPWQQGSVYAARRSLRFSPDRFQTRKYEERPGRLDVYRGQWLTL